MDRVISDGVRDIARQEVALLQAFSDVGGTIVREGGTIVREGGALLAEEMRKVSLEKFGTDKYAEFPYGLPEISNKEFAASTIARNKDDTVSLTDHGRFILKVLKRDFLSLS